MHLPEGEERHALGANGLHERFPIALYCGSGVLLRDSKVQRFSTVNLGITASTRAEAMNKPLVFREITGLNNVYFLFRFDLGGHDSILQDGCCCANHSVLFASRRSTIDSAMEFAFRKVNRRFG